MDGILIVDKPANITSHDVVSFVRRRFHMRSVGHAGTLDPLATGVLIVLLGKATKLFNQFSNFDKAYEATMTLGMTTDTADIQGKVLEESPYDHVTKEKVEEVFRQFVGDLVQTPPMVSAVKVKGKRLYQLARKGIEVAREPRRIRVHILTLRDFNLPKIRFHLECSKGTYVRKIAEDAGKVLGCGGCISEIRRTKIGPFLIDCAVPLNEIDTQHIVQPGSMAM